MLLEYCVCLFDLRCENDSMELLYAPFSSPSSGRTSGRCCLFDNVCVIFLIVGISTFGGRKHVCFYTTRPHIYTHTLTYIQNCLSAHNDLIFSIAKKVVKWLSWQNTKALSLAQVCVLCNLSLQACCFTFFFAFLRKINFQLFQVLQVIHMDVFKHQLLEKYQVL